MKAITAVPLVLVGLLQWGFFSVATLSAEPQAFDLAWKALPGAGGYLVEVRDTQKNLRLTKALKPETTNATLYLEPGKYEVRIVTLNAQKERDGETEWQPIRVLSPPLPEVETLEPRILVQGKPVSVRVLGSHFLGRVEISVTSALGTKVETSFKRISNQELEVDLPALEAGSYSVAVRNSPRGTLVSGGTLSVRFPLPQVVGLEPSTLAPEDEPQVITVSGRDFSPLATINLLGRGQNVFPLAIVSRSGERVMGFISQILPAGDYEVLVSNETGAAQVSAGKLSVKPVVLSLVPRPLRLPPVPQPTEPHLALGLEYDAFSPLGDWKSIYGLTPWGGEIEADWYLSPLKTGSSNGSFNLGFGTRVGGDFFSNPGTEALVESSLFSLQSSVEVAGLWTWPGLNVKTSLGAGLAFSNLTAQSPDGLQNQTSGSLDPLVSGDLALALPLSASWNLTGTASYWTTLSEHPLQGLGLGAGVRFIPQ